MTKEADANSAANSALASSAPPKSPPTTSTSKPPPKPKPKPKPEPHSHPQTPPPHPSSSLPNSHPSSKRDPSATRNGTDSTSKQSLHSPNPNPNPNPNHAPVENNSNANAADHTSADHPQSSSSTTNNAPDAQSDANNSQGKGAVASLASSESAAEGSAGEADKNLKKNTRRRAAAARKAAQGGGTSEAPVQGVFRQGTRRQPLDPYVSLPIRADSGTLKATSLVAAVKLQEGTLTHHVLQDTSTATSKAARINIPAPPSQTAQTFEKVVPDNFKLPSAFIRKKIEDDDKMDRLVEYEVTLEDLEWLARYKSGKLTEHVVEDFTEDGLERMLDLMEKATARNFPISQDKATELFATHLGLYQMKTDSSKKLKRVTSSTNVAQLNKLVEAVYAYWIQKRSKLKKPLLRKFWPITATNDSSPHLVFRPREKERYKLRKKRGNDRDSFDKLVQLYRDFSVVHMLMELLKRRERLNQKKALLQEDAFEQELCDLLHAPSQPKRELVSKGVKIQGTLNVDGAEVESLLVSLGAGEGLDKRGQMAIMDEKARKKRKRRMRDGDDFSLNALWNPYSIKEDKVPAEVKDERASASSIGAPASGRPEAGEDRRKKEKEERKLYQDFLLPLTSKRLYTEVDKESFIYPIIPTFPSTMAHHHNHHHPGSMNQRSDAAQKKPRVRFRFRGRVGRGGRYMIDRIPISCLGPAHVIKAPQDSYVHPHPLASKQDFIDPAKPYPRRTKPITFTPSQRNRLEAIFLQEDSEDEELERLDLAAFSPSAIPPSPKVKEDPAKTKANGPIIRQRVPKMRFELF